MKAMVPKSLFQLSSLIVKEGSNFETMWELSKRSRYKLTSQIQPSPSKVSQKTASSVREPVYIHSWWQTLQEIALGSIQSHNWPWWACCRCRQTWWEKHREQAPCSEDGTVTPRRRYPGRLARPRRQVKCCKGGTRGAKRLCDVRYVAGRGRWESSRRVGRLLCRPTRKCWLSAG